jgi:aspartyl-tRNA(Asn)/glutamyl-tRNA(Gln) amidotransferase subunit A
MHSTIKELSAQLQAGEISSTELTGYYLSEIDKKNEELNIFISVNKEGALAMAKRADEMIAAGEGNELTGIPLGIKDNFCEKGVETSACSNVLNGFVPPYEGTVVAKLREMGAVFLGHTNTDEFTMGSSTESSRFGTSKNPLDPTRSPGGSSGGSAAAVSAGLCAWALGTDTGGSIRQPASFCGVVGMKNTYGRVSRYGVMSMASSLDTIGALTQTSEDSAIVLKHIAGHDEMDGTTPKEEVPDYPALLGPDLKGIKVGVPKEYLEGLNEEVRAQFDAALEKSKGLGAEIVEVSLPMTSQGLAVYYVICPSEVSANMSRYDGLRFGPKSDADNLVDSYFDARTQGFGDEIKRRVIIGTYALSAGYYDAYYKKALKVRTLIKQDFQKAFDEVDVLFTPTTPNVAFEIGVNAEDPIQMYLEDIMTIPASVAGVPAISIPQGSLNGLPLGLQIIGPDFGEGKVLSVASVME